MNNWFSSPGMYSKLCSNKLMPWEHNVKMESAWRDKEDKIEKKE
jgi:hypothetical protein